MKAWLTEIFCSIQGEGPYVGERHLFLRFCCCHRKCDYCDTPLEKSETVLVESIPGSGVFTKFLNPLSVDALKEAIDGFSGFRRLVLTGGEPLLQSDFLEVFLPLSENKVYLETSGDHPERLARIIKWIDVVAMDVKLPSVGKEATDFSRHWEFLRCCREHGTDVFVKIVVSSETDEGEFAQAVAGIRETGGPETLLVLQPLSPTGGNRAVPKGVQLLNWQEMASRTLKNVRIIPQCHKLLGVR